MFAIINAKKNDVLLIDEPDVTLGDKWYRNIGMLEKYLLQKIGEKHNIDALKNIDQYISSANTFICLNDKYIELGSGPISNIRELARKLPELFTKDFIQTLTDTDYETFDQDCMHFFEKVVANAVNANDLKESLFQVDESSQLGPIFKHFQDMIHDSQSLMTNQLHFVLQVLFQTVFSNSKNNLETNYLLSAILSPRFIINEKQLNEDLTFNLRQLGGDLISTKIQDWEIYQEELRFILLESYHGVIELDSLYLFGRLAHKFPFKKLSPFTPYLAIDVRVPIDHGFIDYYKNKRILFSLSERLGSSSPHWEAFIDDQGTLKGTYCYADFQGTKASFHHKKAAEELYSSISRLLPGLVKDDWMHQVNFQSSNDFWMENLGQTKGSSKAVANSFNNRNKHFDALVVEKETRRKIKKIKYWGPLKAQRMGLFGYLINFNHYHEQH